MVFRSQCQGKQVNLRLKRVNFQRAECWARAKEAAAPITAPVKPNSIIKKPNAIKPAKALAIAATIANIRPSKPTNVERVVKRVICGSPVTRYLKPWIPYGTRDRYFKLRQA